MADTEGFQKTLFSEIKGRTIEDDSSYPFRTGEGGLTSKFQYFNKTFKDKGYPAY